MEKLGVDERVDQEQREKVANSGNGAHDEDPNTRNGAAIVRPPR